MRLKAYQQSMEAAGRKTCGESAATDAPTPDKPTPDGLRRSTFVRTNNRWMAPLAFSIPGCLMTCLKFVPASELPVKPVHFDEQAATTRVPIVRHFSSCEGSQRLRSDRGTV
jgi:hypothetical protein